MNIELLRKEIEVLLISLRLANFENNKPNSLIFDFDKMSLRGGQLNRLYSKLSETLYLNEHKINKF